MTSHWLPLIGGMLLGVSTVLLLIANGRIAGISGVVGQLLGGRRIVVNAAFLIGLTAGPLLYGAAYDHLPMVAVEASWPVLSLAGLLIGIGTRMGSGCTSGHGILGLARFSTRSLAATLTFLVMGIVAATTLDMMK